MTDDGKSKFRDSTLVVPSTLKGKTVTKLRIDNFMSNNFYNIDNNSIPDTITELSGDTLSNVNIIPDKNGEFKFPSNLKTLSRINNGGNLTALTTISLPVSLQSLSDVNVSIFNNSFTSLTTINYGGTQEQWTALNFTKPSTNHNTITVHCTDGDITL